MPFPATSTPKYHRFTNEAPPTEEEVFTAMLERKGERMESTAVTQIFPNVSPSTILSLLHALENKKRVRRIGAGNFQPV